MERVNPTWFGYYHILMEELAHSLLYCKQRSRSNPSGEGDLSSLPIFMRFLHNFPFLSVLLFLLLSLLRFTNVNLAMTISVFFLLWGVDFPL